MTHSQARRARNEKQFRDINNQLKKAAERLISSSEAGFVPIEFYCECSDKFCEDRIKLTAVDLETMHKDAKQFVIKRGHEQGDIEEVVAEFPDYLVVKKFESVLA